MGKTWRVSGLRAAAGTALACGVIGVPAAASAAATPYITDALGTHAPGLATTVSSGMIPMAGTGCPPTSVWGTSGQVLLGPGWSSLAIRTGSCTSSTYLGAHQSAFYKNQATHGQFICRGHLTYGYGTNTWYKDNWNRPYGWSWAGGTNQPFWDGSC